MFVKKSSLFEIILACAFCILPTLVHANDVTIPNYWDKNERFTKPNNASISRLRFLTTTDFPPFNFVDGKKRLTGFHVDLARQICAELQVLNRCEIQALPWSELSTALNDGLGDALIAGINVTEKSRQSFEFTRAYIRIPARFVVHREGGISGNAYEALFKKKTAIIKDSAQAAYFKSIFSNRQVVEFENRELAFEALQKKEVDAVFADSLSLSFWLSSAKAQDCCLFLDGAFDSQEYFGDGLAIAVAKIRPQLSDAINYALSEINRKGMFEEIYLRYFPLSLY